MTVATRTLFRSVPSARRSSAQIPITASPSTSSPRSSTAMSRSASPSKAKPISRPAAATVSASRSGCVEPQPSLMFVPFGASNRTVTSAPSERNRSGAMSLAEPLAQSMPMRSPSNASPAISRRWRRVGLRRRRDRRGSGPSSSFGRDAIGERIVDRARRARPRSSSSALRPPTTTFSPLSGAGLWEAETMIPAAWRSSSAGVDQAGRRHHAEVDDVRAGRGQAGGEGRRRASRPIAACRDRGRRSAPDPPSRWPTARPSAERQLGVDDPSRPGRGSRRSRSGLPSTAPASVSESAAPAPGS